MSRRAAPAAGRQGQGRRAASAPAALAESAAAERQQRARGEEATARAGSPQACGVFAFPLTASEIKVSLLFFPYAFAD